MKLNEIKALLKRQNINWWTDLETGEPLERNKGELLALIHSEVSECLEGVRKGLMDDHLPYRTMEEVELADVIIRVLDYCAGFDIDIQGAVLEKMKYNEKRADHKPENRRKENGKSSNTYPQRSTL